MRLAGQSGILEALSGHLAPTEVPASAAPSAEPDVARMEAFFRLFELLLSKGFSEEAAQALAIEMLEGREPMAQETIRFAGSYDDQDRGACAGSW
jgi:hypothetical protein